MRGLIGERISFQNEAFFECSVGINHSHSLLQCSGMLGMEDRGETMITILSATRVQRVVMPSTSETDVNCRGNGSNCMRTGVSFHKHKHKQSGRRASCGANSMFSGSKLLGWFKHKNDLSLDRMK